MDFLEELLDKVPNKNDILIKLSDRFSGNKEYIKDMKYKISKQIILQLYKEKYRDSVKRGTISIKLTVQEISKHLQTKNIFMSDESIRGILNRDSK